MNTENCNSSCLITRSCTTLQLGAAELSRQASMRKVDKSPADDSEFLGVVGIFQSCLGGFSFSLKLQFSFLIFTSQVGPLCISTQR